MPIPIQDATVDRTELYRKIHEAVSKLKEVAPNNPICILILGHSCRDHVEFFQKALSPIPFSAVKFDFKLSFFAARIVCVGNNLHAITDKNGIVTLTMQKDLTEDILVNIPMNLVSNYSGK